MNFPFTIPCVRACVPVKQVSKDSLENVEQIRASKAMAVLVVHGFLNVVDHPGYFFDILLLVWRDLLDTFRIPADIVSTCKVCHDESAEIS